MQAVLGNIIAAAIQIIPLIAVPFLLKGIVDSVPVVGNMAQKAFNRANSGGNKALEKSGFGAVRRAEIMNGQRNMFGFKNNSGRPTKIESFRNRRGAVEEQVKAVEGGRTERFRSAVANTNPEDASVSRNPLKPGEYLASSAAVRARSAHDQTELNQEQGKDTSALFGQQLAEEKARTQNEVGRVGYYEAQTRARGSATTNANNKFSSDYAQRLANAPTDSDFIGPLTEQQLADQSLLKVAGGNVDVEGGMKRAKATAVEANFKTYDQNTAADRALLSQKMSQRNLAILRGDKAADGGALEGPNTILRDAMKTGDSNEVLAARDLLMTQGSSGVMTLQSYIRSLEEDKTLGPNGAFSGDRQEILNQLKRTQMSEHGAKTKEVATGMIDWANSASTMRMSMQNQGRYTALTDSELGKQSTASLIQGVANGAIDRERAAAILSDDTLRKDYDEQQREVLQMVKDFGSEAVVATWNPDTGKVWVDDKEKDPKKLQAAQEAYKRYIDVSTEARIALNRQLPVNDPNYVNDDDVQAIGLTPVVPGKLPVPKPSSITPVIMDYLDKVGGPSRTSKDSFIKLQQTIREAPDAADDNDDLKKTILQMDADSKRRNDEADRINSKARRSKGSVVIADNEKYTYIAGEPGSTEASQSRQARDQQRQQLAETIRQAAAEFNTNLQGMGIDNTRSWDSFDDATMKKMSDTLNTYRQSLRSARGTSNSDQLSSSLRESLRKDMEDTLNGNQDS